MSSNEEVKFRTSCEKCYFAEFSKNEDRTYQSGCAFNRLSRYKEINKLDELTDDRNYFIINTICNSCRDHEWAKKYENPMKQVIEETLIRVHAFIVDMSEDEIDEVKERINKSFEALLKSSILPKTIHIILQNPKLVSEAMDIYNNLKSRTDIKILLSTTYNKTRQLDMIDSVISLVEQPYYMIVMSGEETEADYLEKINYSINVKLNPVIMTNNVYLTGLHRSLNGNNTEVYKNNEGDEIVLSSLREKIMTLVDEQKTLDSVLKV